MRPERAYLVCGTNRSGSNLLCGLLKSTGVAGRPEEYFWRGHEHCWAERWSASGPDEFLSGAVREGTSANGVFGAKVMWPHLPDLLEKLRAVHGDRGDRMLLELVFPATRFVWIRRDDVVAQAVSFSRAIQTEEWTAHAPDRADRAARFDFDHIHRLHGELCEQNDAWPRWFEEQGIDPHAVLYEDLVADMGGVTRSVIAFLGVELPADATIGPQHERQAGSVNAEWAERYRQMVLWRSGSAPSLRP